MTAMTTSTISVATAEPSAPAAPNFHIGLWGRVLLGFSGVMIPAATVLYMYGQLSPGV